MPGGALWRCGVRRAGPMTQSRPMERSWQRLFAIRIWCSNDLAYASLGLQKDAETPVKLSVMTLPSAATRWVSLFADLCTSCHNVLEGAARYGALPMSLVRFEMPVICGPIRPVPRQQHHAAHGGIQPYEKEQITAWLTVEHLARRSSHWWLRPQKTASTPMCLPWPFATTATQGLLSPDEFWGDGRWRLGLWSVELYRVSPVEAWLVGYDIYETPSRIGRSVRFEPDLPICCENRSGMSR